MSETDDEKQKRIDGMLDRLLMYTVAYVSQQTGVPRYEFLKEPYRTEVRQAQENDEAEGR